MAWSRRPSSMAHKRQPDIGGYSPPPDPHKNDALAVAYKCRIPREARHGDSTTTDGVRNTQRWLRVPSR